MSKVRTASVALAATTAALLAASPVAHADESGINGSVAVTAAGSGGHVRQVWVKTSSIGPYIAFTGFYRLFGPDYNVTSETRKWGQNSLYYHDVNRDYANGQKHCAEGWRQTDDGSFELIGRPCVENPI
ncbi:hypothetical protein [Lentzea cavernae]|uniref:Uncharacterized protein n=1 Tax=Lentzea cavernae TaxID=2020703 RepID=A0ABQ3MIA1_9PSEU|nr:hypothetical protein [Lentzea cavernae]GHH46271.1 hypothetical protein GCM10017774_48950 [Lentzea cavernae]